VDRLAAFDRSSARVEHEGRSIRDARVEGWTADYPSFRDSELSAGRHFNAFEERNSRPVAVIGSEVAERVFRGASPVGKTIRVYGRHLEVIGVLEEQSGFLGHDPNVVVVAPLGRFRKIFGARRSLSVRLRVAEIASLEDARHEVRMHMRKDDFAVTSSERIVTLWKSISQAIFTALVLLVSISLVVGGVVIMNIMLVSVTERTREVGTRKALGARRVDILWQFLAESVTLSMIGGVLGILLGCGLASAISVLSPLPYAIKPW
jgi:putative ABC transport system permease protein